MPHASIVGVAGDSGDANADPKADVFALNCVPLMTLGVGWAVYLRLRRFIENLLGLVEGD